MTRENNRQDLPAQTTSTARRSGAYDDRMGASLGSLPSLSAFYDQGLTLRACTESYAWAHGRTADALRALHLREILGEAVFQQVRHHAERCVAGETQHVVWSWTESTGPTGPTGRRFVRQMTLVPYVVDGEQVGFAVLTDDVEV